MGYVDSSNLYAFAGGDPVNQRDPLGLCGERGQRKCGFFGSAWKSVNKTVGEQVEFAVDAYFYLKDFASDEGRQRNAQSTFDVGLRMAKCGEDPDCALARLRQPQDDALRYLNASPEERKAILGDIAGRWAVYGAEAYVTGKLSDGTGTQGAVANEPAPSLRARVANAYRNSILSSETGAVGPEITNQSRAARASSVRLRDARGRFITDPDNPPSPYVFTDSQRRAAWKKLVEDPLSPLTAAERVVTRARGWRGPQRYNEFGELETMELSHEPVPLREGGTQVVPRWPADHAEIDPHRHLKKR